eukprot:scaffold380149_cov18-Prasinocladus_malaysianus.AAC.1
MDDTFHHATPRADTKRRREPLTGRPNQACRRPLPRSVSMDLSNHVRPSKHAYKLVVMANIKVQRNGVWVRQPLPQCQISIVQSIKIPLNSRTQWKHKGR